MSGKATAAAQNASKFKRQKYVHVFAPRSVPSLEQPASPERDSPHNARVAVNISITFLCLKKRTCISVRTANFRESDAPVAGLVPAGAALLAGADAAPA